MELLVSQVRKVSKIHLKISMSKFFYTFQETLERMDFEVYLDSQAKKVNFLRLSWLINILMCCLFKVKRENKDFQWLVHLARKEMLVSLVERENAEIKEKEVSRVSRAHLDILERKVILESLGN